MKRAIVDLSSVLWTCLQAGKDKEFGKEYTLDDGKKLFVNSAIYGYENAINHLVTVMQDLNLNPNQLILVEEGRDAKAIRQNMMTMHYGAHGYPKGRDGEDKEMLYKVGRDKSPALYEQFNILKERVTAAFLGLGAQLCWQDGGVEADDVIAYLAQNLRGERYVVSNDKDLAQLIGPGPRDTFVRIDSNGENVWSGYIHHYRMGQLDKNPFGPFDTKFIPVAIALVGDPSDKISGAKGFGEKAFENLLVAFGDDGLELMEDLIKERSLVKLQEDVGELKALQKVIDDADSVYLSYALGCLMPDKVNTVRRPLSWKAGMVKPREQCEDERLRKYAGQSRIVSAENYDEVVAWAKKQILLSPSVALDVETSTPPESDEWLERQGKEDKVDVFGSELTSLQLTFGPNNQYTVYLPIDNIEEPGVTNVTIQQARDFVDLVPREKVTYIQNVSFELPVCYNAWGETWSDDPEYHGFLRNVRDTKIMSSYVDENYSAGLKDNSKRLLGYEQISYAGVTTKEYTKDQWLARPESRFGLRGKVLGEWREPVSTGTVDESGAEIMDHENGPLMIKVQHKMNELTARDVLGYGADDTICTIAVANHFRVIMEIEETWDIFEEVETFPAYLTALAFVQGTPISLEDMRQMEKEDQETYDKAWPVLRDYLMSIGFEGTVCPVMVPTLDDAKDAPSHLLDFTPKGIKAAYQIVTGQELSTQVRTPSKLAKLIAQEAETLDDPQAALILADAVDKRALDMINSLIASKFSGEPVLDLNSPKQMAKLLYDHIGIPVRVINDVTDLERKHNVDLDLAVRKFKKIRAGSATGELSPDEKKLVRTKAKANDDAIDLALAFDVEAAGISPEAQAAMRAIAKMKKVLTRQNLYYANYWHVQHWKDGLVHASANQCAAVTRRYSMSMPNLQQLPKKGDGVKFRGIFKPHTRDGVICSIDFVGQELRLAAEKSQDKNMLACYVGDNLKDIHSITAAGAMKLKWGPDAVREAFGTWGDGLTDDAEGIYRLFMRLRELGKSDPIGKRADDLRKDAKNVNFGAQNGAKAVKLAETLIMLVSDAQLFLDARSSMFPDVDTAAEDAAQEAKRLGYSLTFMGARRHLRDAMLSNERGAADRAARQAWNYEIQGSAGEMTKLAMARLWQSGVLFRLRARFIAPIHDELVTSVHKDDAVEFIRIKHECIAQPYSTMTVPILGSVSLGPDFANQIECGDWFIEERVRKAVDSVFEERLAA